MYEDAQSTMRDAMPKTAEPWNSTHLEAAVRIQAQQRRSTVRKARAREGKAATMIQSLQRGRMTRQKMQAATERRIDKHNKDKMNEQKYIFDQ
eukprot:SAG31_NODE_17395_length_672_cov_1.071553_1_plen_92_part_01